MYYKAFRHFFIYGPSDRIRTCGILLPKQARYQLRYTRISVNASIVTVLPDLSRESVKRAPLMCETGASHVV